MKRFYNFMRGLCGWAVRLLYPVKIIGNKKNVPKDGKIVLISNHLGFSDVPVLVVYFPGFRHFLSKKEFSEKKIVKWFFTKMGVFFVDRNHMDMNAIRTGVNYLKSGESIALFPEGTRNVNDTNLQQIKGGAALFAVKGEAPLVPVIFHNKAKIFRRTYVYVGEPIDLSEYYGKRFGAGELDSASALIGQRMEADKEFIDDFVLNKRWKNKQIEGKKN